MADQSIIIKFKSSGDKKLKRAIEGLEDATRELQGKTKRLRKENNLLGTGFKRNSKNAGMLNNAFSTMRSKLLLVNFAMGLGISQLIKFAKEASKVRDMERAFTSLQGSTANSNIAFQHLSEAVDGTMSKVDLFKQANNAMILGITKNSSEMAEMFDMAQRLGKALGLDAANAVESLITGIGRQSRLMLDNIGIVVKADEAYEMYASNLNKSVDRLTDAEKKQAFLNATMTAAREKVSNLPPETRTASETFAAFSTEINDTKNSIGDFIIGGLQPLMEEFLNFRNIRKDVNMDAMEESVSAVALENAIKRIRFQRDELQKKLKKAQQDLAPHAIHAPHIQPVEFTEEDQKALDIANKNLEFLEDRFTNIAVSTEQAEKSLGETMFTINDFGTNMSEVTDDDIARFNLEMSKLRKETEKKNKQLKDEIALLEIRRGSFGDEIIFANSEIKLMQEKASLMTDGLEKDKLLIEIDLKKQELQKLEIERNNEIIEQDKEIIALEQQKYQQKLKTVSQAISSGAALMALNEKNHRHVAKLQAISATIDAFAAAQSQYATVSKILPPPYPQIAYGAALTQGLAQAGRVSGFFEQGGLVGGRRHSQGGTIIEAEQGEFVMSRSAVEAVGIETMNRINQGGGAGITVNVSGNVMTQDFVENDLAEAIKEAARKGADFGIS